MKSRKALIPVLIVAIFVIALTAVPAGAAPLQSSGSFSRSISSSGTSSLQSYPAGGDELQFPEFVGEPDEDAGPAPFDGSIVDRSHSNGQGHGASVNSGKKAKSNPELNISFDGLNHRQQRLANNGNQFSVEPPDQGLCAGNGYVMETVNDVLRVFDTNGNPLTGVIDQNTFYGYPPAINRSTLIRGPFVTDPSCYFDQATQRWFQIVLTLDTLPNGAFTGKNHLDLAVSQTSNPTGIWNIYRLPAQDDGTDGSPDHNCPLHNDGTGHGPCLGDYPHIGADANGFYITTNEYAFFPDNIYIAAQVYALSKAALASGAANLTVTQFNTLAAAAGNPGFTIWPAVSPAGQYRSDNGGTEFFLSSDAAEEAHGNGSSNRIFLWQLTNTASLNTASPSVALSNVAIPTGTYGIPPKSDQRPGDIPLGQCINDTTTTITSLGPPFVGCWQALFVAEPAHDEVESHIDSNDTRMQQVVYANGKVWGALDTAITVGGTNKAGIEWFVVNPGSANIVKQGYLALANNNLTYPAIGVTPSGRGVMAFTVVGADYYPSAGYAAIDANVGVGDVHIAAAGLGPDDGFTSYKAEVGNPPRTRWGDYGAAVMDGNSIWIASEYIGQTCTFAQYIAAPFGSCGGTRTSLGNWGTRISKVTP